MHKKSIFGWINCPKLVIFILLVALVVSSCSTDPPPVLPPVLPPVSTPVLPPVTPPTVNSIEFTLATVPTNLPTKNIWIITDGNNTAGDASKFNALETALAEAESADREIELLFSNIETIPDYAFLGCTALTTIDLPKATTIGKQAFSGCTDLTTLTLPKVTEILYQAFSGCTALETVDLPNATFIGIYAFWKCTALTTIDLPNAETIGGNAFMKCEALTTLNLPNAKFIKSQAFRDCIALTTIDLPNAETIGEKAFSGSYRLTTMTIATKSSTLALHTGVFADIYPSGIKVTTSADNKNKIIAAGITENNITVQE